MSTTTPDKSWQLGGTSSLSYRLFDALRSRLNRRLVAWLVSEGLDEDISMMLEAGSGTAFASSLLREQPGVVPVALDYDIEAMREAKARDPRLICVVGDMNALPFRADTFDLTWNSSTIEHLPDFDHALGEMARVTQADGRVFTGVPHLYGPLGFQKWIARTKAGIWIGPVYSGAQVQARHRARGLTPVHSLTYFLRVFVGVLSQKRG